MTIHKPTLYLFERKIPRNPVDGSREGIEYHLILGVPGPYFLLENHEEHQLIEIYHSVRDYFKNSLGWELNVEESAPQRDGHFSETRPISCQDLRSKLGLQ